ncbi:E3 ubiquitin-protein ligase PUB23-like [Ananas comosus]|uniref:U-box domain-containing protein n=1 Tax=Ananas comosus TaxID=4615 RepID=A0A199VA06_ANACO|nr:E3 ubiquitin-protein ligase PUB23-like [Ananas comosus]OAY73942.1 E3 ubiquitin-protein ligase PUB23 [Ananas comosus]
MEEEEAPLLFRCPISMDLMADPVTIATGVSYERKNIEKWLLTYKRSTCPATMQHLDTLDLTPNHTLKRLISTWLDKQSANPNTTDQRSTGDLISRLTDIESSPFKVNSLRSLKSMLETSEEMQNRLLRSGGIEVLARIMSQATAAADITDFSAFRACEEAAGVVSVLPLYDEASSSAAEILLRPKCVKPMTAILQRGSAEARIATMDILVKMARINRKWIDALGDDQNTEVLKSLLDLLSDEISTRKLSSLSLEVLLSIVAGSKGGRSRAVDVGAVPVLIELLPDADRHTCERILLLLKRLCECPEGRSAFAEHAMGVAAVAKKILRVSDGGTKVGVKILWLVCSFFPTEKVLDEMMASGAVKKLLALVHVDGRPSTKEKAIKIIRMHGMTWRQYPCFPGELRDYLRLMHETC